jgi:hypothetical protein
MGVRDLFSQTVRKSSNPPGDIPITCNTNTSTLYKPPLEQSAPRWACPYDHKCPAFRLYEYPALLSSIIRDEFQGACPTIQIPDYVTNPHTQILYESLQIILYYLDFIDRR